MPPLPIFRFGGSTSWRIEQNSSESLRQPPRIHKKGTCNNLIRSKGPHCHTQYYKNLPPSNSTIFVFLQITKLLLWIFVFLTHFKTIKFSDMISLKVFSALRFKKCMLPILCRAWLSSMVSSNFKVAYIFERQIVKESGRVICFYLSLIRFAALVSFVLILDFRIGFGFTRFLKRNFRNFCT